MKHNGTLTLAGYIDLLQNELRNARLQNLASDPSSPVTGQAYYNTGTNRLRIYGGAGPGWIELGPSAGAFTNEDAQDAVGGIMTSSGTVTLTYDDVANTITAAIASGSVTSALIADDTIVNADVKTSAAILLSKTADDAASAGRLAMTNAERTKLSGVATGATANATDAALRDRALHTGTQSLDTTSDSATRLAMTAAERTKLTGVATAATANATDANLRDRATHTGTQTSSTISDFTTAVDTLATAKVTALIGGAPAALDTLNELATALGNDASFATTVNTALGLRTKKYSATFGNGSLTSFTINHGLALAVPQALTVSVFLAATGVMETCDVAVTDANNIVLSGFATAPASNAYRVTVIG